MNWKKFGKKLLFPPVWLTVLLTLVSTGGLIAVFTGGYTEHPLAYGVYAVSFYTLSVACLFCWKVLPGMLPRIKKALQTNPVTGPVMTDRTVKVKLSLYLSLTVSLVYALLQLLGWVRSRSWWFVVLACYYTILALMRFLLVRYVRAKGIGRDLPGEWKRARLCACILLLINLTLSGAVLMILYSSRGYDYPGVLIYVMAAYTFYATTHAIVEIVRRRSQGSPVMSAAKIISLSAALISMLNLETAMFAQFGGDMNPEHRYIFIILTGAGISLTVVTLSIWLIVSATIEIRRNQHE